MGWWSQLTGRSFRATDAEYLASMYGGEDTAGEVVTTQQAMKLSAFWACTRLYSQIIATLPLVIYQKTDDGRVPRDDHPLSRIIRESPNADQTAVEFWEGRVLGLCTTGNGYAEKVTGAGGRIISLEHMPADTFVRRTDTGALEYRYYSNGNQIILPAEKVFHIRGFGGGEGYCGMSPVTHARQTLGLAMATDRAARQTFSRGMRAKGFFVMPPGTKLDADQRAQAQKNLVAPFSGPNGKDWGVLEGGVTAQTVSITPRDAELILSRKFNIEDICRWFGVPPMMIGHAGDGTTMWGTGVEQIMLGWYKTGLIPYLERIEQRIKKDLLTNADRAAGIYAEFNVEALLRGDSASVTANLVAQIQNAIRKPNEARSILNIPHEDGGDELLASVNLVPLKILGTQRSAVAAGAQPNPASEPTVPGPGGDPVTPAEDL